MNFLIMIMNKPGETCLSDAGENTGTHTTTTTMPLLQIFTRPILHDE